MFFIVHLEYLLLTIVSYIQNIISNIYLLKYIYWSHKKKYNAALSCINELS